MSRVSIRPLRSEDAERVAELATQLGYPSVAADILHRMTALPADGSHAVLVAEAEGAVAGWVHVFIGHAIESDPRGEIIGLVVDQSRRRKGIGRLLMQHAEDWARARGATRMALRSNVIRTAAHEFYKSLGYAVAKTQYAFNKSLTTGKGREKEGPLA